MPSSLPSTSLSAYSTSRNQKLIWSYRVRPFADWEGTVSSNASISLFFALMKSSFAWPWLASLCHCSFISPHFSCLEEGSNLNEVECSNLNEDECCCSQSPPRLSLNLHAIIAPSDWAPSHLSNYSWVLIVRCLLLFSTSFKHFFLNPNLQKSWEIL